MNRRTKKAGRNRQPKCDQCRPALRPMFTSDAACVSVNDGSSLKNLSFFFFDPAAAPSTTQSPARSPTTFPTLYPSPDQNTVFFTTSDLFAQNSSDPNVTVLTSSSSLGFFAPDPIDPTIINSTIGFNDVNIPLALIGFADFQVSIPTSLSSLITQTLSNSGQWSATISATNATGESCVLTNPAYSYENGTINFFTVEVIFPVNVSPCTFVIQLTINTS